MDILSPSWLTELGMEDPIFMDHCDDIDSFEEDLAAAFVEDFQNSFSPESNSSSSTLIPRSRSTTTLCASASIEAPPSNTGLERPTKHHKPEHYNSRTINNVPSFDKSFSAPIILDFGCKSSRPENGQQGGGMEATNGDDNDSAAKGGQRTKKAGTRTRPPSKTYDHIIAERKRREQLSQRFVALSTIVPGLKKMDKTSVLGDAIKYLKQLQERVQTLEEQASKQTMESVVLVRKSQLLIEDEGSSDEISPNQSLPEIEARVCNKSVLLRIHCEKHKGVLVNILSEIENMHLSVANTSVSSFGTLALDITIIAEMEKEFNMKVKDMVRSIRSALRRVT